MDLKGKSTNSMAIFNSKLFLLLEDSSLDNCGELNHLLPNLLKNGDFNTNYAIVMYPLVNEHNYGKSTCFMKKLPVSVSIFNSKLLT